MQHETATVASIKVKLPQFNKRNRVASSLKNLYFAFFAIAGFATTEGASALIVFKAMLIAVLFFAPLGVYLHNYVRKVLWSDLSEVIAGKKASSIKVSRELIRLPFQKTVVDTVVWVSGAFSIPAILHICGATEGTCSDIQMIMLWMTPLSVLVELLVVYEANRPFEQIVGIRQALPDPFYLSEPKRWAILVAAVVYALVAIIAWLYLRTTETATIKTTAVHLPYVMIFCAVAILAVLLPFAFYFARNKKSTGGLHCPSCKNSVAENLLVCPYDGTLLSFPAGESALSQKYEFLEQIGRGGMGTVYKARHIMLDRPVAIKVLDTKGSAHIDTTRFQREAKMATMLDSPYIVKVHDFGLLPDGKCFLAMEFLVGETLSEKLRKDECLAIADWFNFSKQLSTALREVHKHKIVHRDIKPSNIMLVTGRDGKFMVKLIDFGVAKIQDAATLTGTGEVLGTPYYMSPEQCRGLALDERADIYSLCCLLYEALLGRPPLIGESSIQTIFMHLNETALPPSHVCPELPSASHFDAFFERGLTKAIEDRFADVNELLVELEKLQSEISKSATAAGTFKAG